MNLKIVLSKIDTYSDKLLHGRSPSLWRSAATPWHYDAVQVRPSTPSRVEDLPAQPRRWYCRNGSFCCSNAFLSAALWFADSLARPAPDPVAGSDGPSNGRMDGPAIYRGLRLGRDAPIYRSGS